MLTTGNTKLGREVLVWSLPAITTCPGASEACRNACYATAGHYHRENVRDSLKARERESRKKRFVSRVIEDLKKHQRRLVRIHASGDFYSPEYTAAWVEIARACPEKLFFAYTRSWREAGILPVLRELAALDNVRLWFSCDRETGSPPRTPRVRRAYMACDDSDEPVFRVSLVFRVVRSTVRKRWNGPKGTGGTLVCPVENGVTVTTCEKCGICWKSPKGTTVKLAGRRTSRVSAAGRPSPGGRRHRPAAPRAS